MVLAVVPNRRQDGAAGGAAPAPGRKPPIRAGTSILPVTCATFSPYFVKFRRLPGPSVGGPSADLPDIPVQGLPAPVTCVMIASSVFMR